MENLPEMSNGAEAILRDCEALERLDDARPSASDRLHLALGDKLARFLVCALTRRQGRRTSSSP
jgi:hypothetical protein